MGLIGGVLILWGLASGLAAPPDLILIAHRGVVTDTLTENSLSSLEETIRRGYTHIEVDLRCTKDGQAVCLHDPNLRRTAGVKDNIADVTLAELRELVSEDLVPSFEAFSARCEGRIDLMPDIKDCAPEMREAFVKSIERSLERHGLIEGAFFIGRPDVGRHFEGRAKLPLKMTLQKAKEKNQGGEKLGEKYYIFNHAQDNTETSVKAFQALGLKVIVSINTHHYMTGDPMKDGPADVKRMLGYGVDGLQIDSVYEDALQPAVPVKE